MQIQFNPDIHQTIQVSPPLLAPHTSSYVVVRFSALAPMGEYKKLGEEGAKVQLWSDNTGSDWQAHDFLEDTEATNHDTDHRRLSLNLPVILPTGLAQLKFCYTYRVLFPDGRIIWFGEFGQNGVCIVNSHDSHATLGYDWYSKDGITYELDTDGDSRSLEVLRGIGMDGVRVHAIDSDGSLGHSKRCSLLFVIPQFSPDAYVVPQAFSISSSISAMSLGSGGVIMVDDNVKASLLLQVHDGRLNLLPEIERAVAHGLSGRGRILSFSSRNDVAVLASSTSHQHPLRLVAIALSPMTCDQNTDFELDPSKELDLPEGMNTICVYSSADEIHYFSEKALTSTIHIPMTFGMQYILAPVCHMQSQRFQSELWRISILSDHTNMHTSFQESSGSVLLTPPPSPPTESKEISYNTALKIRANTIHYSRLVACTRYVFAFIFSPLFVTYWVLSIIRSIIRRSGMGRPRETRLHGMHRTNSKLEEDKHKSSTQQTVDLLPPAPCKIIHAHVFPGLLTLLLRSEHGTTDDLSNVLNVKLDGEALDGTIEHKGKGTFLYTCSIDQGGEIDIALV
ncbi:hypothetical protein APHAL10511_006510 [Amanita phalloides]|nr:hypothetical protein APHAL10511_006510 [Amanita phalloides]